jgi:nitrogen regulatory protein PII
MQNLLILNTRPELEEDLVDYLLSLSCVSGFTSYPVRGHGHHQNLSVAEQVSGRRKRMQVEIMLEEDAVPTVLSGLVGNVGRDINWWRMPVMDSGMLD